MEDENGSDLTSKLISQVIPNGLTSGFDRMEGKELTLNAIVTVFGFLVWEMVYF